MYSTNKSVQQLVALLKSYNIKDVVLSPGGSDIPIIHSIEMDSFFTCYSVVDERSAAYFAMGVAQNKNSPVAIVCTSGSAVCNYLPGITEAFYQDVPIVAITADKNPLYQGQLEIQKINQDNIFGEVVKKSVTLPVVNSEEEEWLCNRLINEALLELNHHGCGPVHINIPIVGRTDLYDCDMNLKVRKISRTEIDAADSTWKSHAETLLNAKKILVIVGQNLMFSKEDIENMNTFFKRFNCVFATEKLSNLECDGTVSSYILSEVCALDSLSMLTPDIVISIGNNLAAYQLKPYLRNHSKHIKNFLVHPNGKVRDAYRCLSDIFECTSSYFFKKIISYTNDTNASDMSYYNDWQSSIQKVELPEFEYSNFYLAQELAKVMPANSTLHLAILNSTRIMQFFDFKHNIRTYSNVGTLGIDGCFSTFAGQAAATEELAFLVIGDLSFFYDMNAAGLRSIGNNVRVILLNNGGGSEFHFFMGKSRIPTINAYISAQHSNVAKGWIESLGYKYFEAKSKDDISLAMQEFGEKSDRPLFLEVFTSMEEDAAKTNEFYHENQSKIDNEINGKFTTKKIAKKLLSEKQIAKAKNIIKAIKD